MIEGELTFLDYGLIFVLAVLIPAWGYMDTKVLQRKLKNGEQGVLRKTYKQSMFMLWTIFALVVATWLWHDRPMSALGLRLSSSVGYFSVWAFVLLVGALQVLQVWQARHQQKLAEAILQKLAAVPTVSQLLPVTAHELRLFNGLSVTAGITEEVIYRGYLIWAFAQWMPVWQAAAVSLGIFIVGHAYQGTLGSLVRVAVTGLVLTLVYLLSGSLLPAIFLHIIIDIASGLSVWRARQWEASPQP